MKLKDFKLVMLLKIKIVMRGMFGGISIMITLLEIMKAVGPIMII